MVRDVFARRDGEWRAIRPVAPGLPILGATMLGDRLLVLHPLSIDELHLDPP